MPSHATADVTFLSMSQGGRSTSVCSGYRGQFHHRGEETLADVVCTFPPGESISPGQSSYCEISFCRPDVHVPRLQAKDTFEVREGRRVVATGRLMTILREAEQETDPWEETLFVLLYLSCDRCGADLDTEVCWDGLSSAAENALVFAARAATLAQTLGWTRSDAGDYFCPTCSRAHLDRNAGGPR